jgi:hypothetical protein
VNIAFVTEMGFVGKIPREHLNMRVEFAWMCALGADHYPHTVSPNKKYDMIVVILPKKGLDNWIQLDVLLNLRSHCSKLAIMQEGPHWYFQDYDVRTQFWFHSVMSSVDVIFVHNQLDKKYYSGVLENQTIHVLPSLMIEDSVKNFTVDGRDGVMVGGNFCHWYGGFDSYIVARQQTGPIRCPSMGRKQPQEDSIPDIQYLPYLTWSAWVMELSNSKIGVHLMRTHAAGTFALNCAYLGIPCIGYAGLDTQETCHPDTTVELADIPTAKKLMQRLSDPEEYEMLARKSRELYEKNYRETVFLQYMKNIIGE